MSSPFRPFVSITIPTYNRADSYLRGAIESALAQTYPHVEVLVADNASTDATAELVGAFDDPRLRYERHEENRGPFGNSEFCLEAARGEFICMLHDDDLIDPDFLDTCVDALAEDPEAGYVLTGLRTIDAEGALVETYPNPVVGLQHEAYVDAWLQGRMYWYFANMLIRTDALRALDDAFSRYHHASDCANIARLALAHRGVNVRDVKASCRLHDEKITQVSAVSDWIDEYEMVRDDLVALVDEEWKTRIRDGANDFFSQICYRHADRIASRAQRYRTLARIYRVFDGKRIPPTFSAGTRRLLPRRVVRWVRRVRGPSVAPPQPS